MASTRLEVQLVLCCARAHMDAERVRQLRGLLREDLDWSDVLQTAHRHAVMPLVYHNLKTLCPDAVPQAIFSQLRARFFANVGHNLFLTQKLLMLLRLLEMEGISAIPYKGPVLATVVYGNLALR